ncbi:MAG: bifunctional glutamate N-acetyltransferase/amino-acid acetyltransferase ArgJ [Clostridiales Family XIII bacterium]|jgi:glutamate N-acetyltransferase/amino-acid N-acetyltransferase|nr:bifunctional glutamate N-acetyltransferase/amino-acid acetyltransferase ArgJ [Clostridiales Family XIII bacterium]
MKKYELTYIENGVCAPRGFKAAGIHCGFRKNIKKNDLSLIVSDVMCNAAAVFTQNKLKGAPVLVNREHLKDGKARAIICNSGNANTCAPGGLEIAYGTCRLTAEALGINENDVIVCSTGVIGSPIYLETFENGIPKVIKKLSYKGSNAAARGIMTTDKAVKEVAVSFKAGGKICRMGAIAKGSGMINPNMATMLCFITTDAAIDQEVLQSALSADIKDSFNQISIDGDTSTNDTVAIMANGLACNAPITGSGEDLEAFRAALRAISSYICHHIVKDGEGASKILKCMVSGAPNKDVARGVSLTVIQSDLVKTSVFGEDANWGRVLVAVGYSDKDFEVENIDIALAAGKSRVDVCKHSVACLFDEDMAKKILSQKEVHILIDLNQGDAGAIAYGCDMTLDYVRVNARYRT